MTECEELTNEEFLSMISKEANESFDKFWGIEEDPSRMDIHSMEFLRIT